MNSVLNLSAPLVVTLKDLCKGKVSIAIQAMIDGLKTQSQRDDFKVDMFSFADVNGKVCYGCAATCAVMQLTKTDLTINNIVAHRYKSNDNGTSRVWPAMVTGDIEAFENAINDARTGRFKSLFEYFEVTPTWGQKLGLYLKGYKFKRSVSVIDSLPLLDNDSWEKNLNKYEKFVVALQKVGL